MRERLNDAEFELFDKLRGEYIKCIDELFDEYCDKGCLDYVWVECNGEKKPYLYGWNC